MCVNEIINGNYRTPPRRVSLLAKLFPSLVFYPKFLGVILRASRMAKKKKYSSHLWNLSSLDILRALESVGVHGDVEGLNYLKETEGPVVIIANHMSMMETMLMPLLINPIKKMTFVVKKSLVEYPVFKHIMLDRDPITVIRDNPREDLKTVMEGGVKRLTNGISVTVFPQTTRTEVFDPEQFNTIGVKLAKKAKASVIPVALKTSAWRNGKIIKDMGRIEPKDRFHFSFGKSMRIQGRGQEEHQEIVEFIQRKLKQWEAEDAKS